MTAFEIESTGPLRLTLVDDDADTLVAAVHGPVRILVDGSIVEVFADGPSATSRHYPTATSRWVIESDSPYRAWRLG